MNLSEIFTNFNIGKGLSKVILGALAMGIAYLIKDPSSLMNIIPEQWQTMAVVGFVTEGLDYVQNLIEKAKEKA